LILRIASRARSNVAKGFSLVPVLASWPSGETKNPVTANTGRARSNARIKSRRFIMAISGFGFQKASGKIDANKPNAHTDVMIPTFRWVQGDPVA
jgi:hypothetical protein